MKTEFITNIKPIFVELKFTFSTPLSMLAFWTLGGYTPSVLSVGLMDGLDTIEILTWKSIFLNYLQDKLFKLFGMELQSLLEDSQPHKSIKKTMNTLQKLFLIKVKKLFWVLQEILTCSCVQLSAPTWVAFQFHIWEHTMDGFVSVTGQCTINLVELDKVLPFKTFLILITQATKTELSYALRP